MPQILKGNLSSELDKIWTQIRLGVFDSDRVEQLKHGLLIDKFRKLIGGDEEMVEKQVQVKLRTGLQARPAALFVQEANRFSSDVFLEKDGKKVNAKSIMGLMSLAISSGSFIQLIVEGNDENEAIVELANFIEQEG
jgi:catabolite repression HPr-like protein